MSLKMFVFHRLVVFLPHVVISLEFQYVNVFRIIVAHLPTVDQSVLRLQNVLVIRLVLMNVVLIHVQMLVVSIVFAMSLIISLNAVAFKAMKEILS